MSLLDPLFISHYFVSCLKIQFKIIDILFFGYAINLFENKLSQSFLCYMLFTICLINDFLILFQLAIYSKSNAVSIFDDIAFFSNYIIFHHCA